MCLCCSICVTQTAHQRLHNQCTLINTDPCAKIFFLGSEVRTLTPKHKCTELHRSMHDTVPVSLYLNNRRTLTYTRQCIHITVHSNVSPSKILNTGTGITFFFFFLQTFFLLGGGGGGEGEGGRGRRKRGISCNLHPQKNNKPFEIKTVCDS